ncbi:30S ribosomal protein S20 [Candidatus Babeliales bacterium]|nr:30S ribosomal protein S20 [Candidatus Babeliales bacterium]
MANIKSAKKRAKQNIEHRQRNLGRKTAIKTAVKKVLAAVEAGQTDSAKALLRDAEAQMMRAAGKNLMHKKTASRRTGRLAKRVAALQKSA